MSGRIRTIKPELLEDAVSAGVSHAAFRLYVGAIVLSDDFGNFRAEPRKLLGDVFWARPEVTVGSVAILLSELAEAGRTPTQPGLFGLYRVRGQLYGHIRNWEKHQKVDKIGNPRCPKPDDKEAVQCPPDERFSREPRELLGPDLDLDPDHDPYQDPPFGGLLGATTPSACLAGSSIGPTAMNSACRSDDPKPTLARKPDAFTLPRQPELLAACAPKSGVATQTTCTPEREVFEHWVTGWKQFVRGVRVPKLDEKRRGKIKARLREGYTVTDLKLAVDGLWSSAWHIENKRHDIELVCRDAPHVDQFIARCPEDLPNSRAHWAPLPPEPTDEEILPMTPEEREKFERELADSGTTATLRAVLQADLEQGSKVRLRPSAEANGVVQGAVK